MSFEEYWQRLTSANPSLRETHKMSISVDAFQECIHRAYTEGVKQGIRSQGFFDKIFGSLNR